MKTLILVIIAIILITFGIFLVTSLTGAPYVPTLRKDFEKALKNLLKLDKNDLLIDLGAGDGVILDVASKAGAKALGIELNPILALIIRFRFRKNKDVSVKCQNFYSFNFPKETTVIYTFAVGPHIEPIYRKIKKESNRLKKSLFFISNAFDLKDLKPKRKSGTWYLYKITPENNSLPHYDLLPHKK